VVVGIDRGDVKRGFEIPLRRMRRIARVVKGVENPFSLLEEWLDVAVEDGNPKKSNWTTLPHRNSGFKGREATPQIPNKARDNRTHVLEYS
jgi:hypothetical protein